MTQQDAIAIAHATTPTTPRDQGASALRRVAAIDVGSNSIRLTVAEGDATGYELLTDERENARLAAEIDAKGNLNDDAITRAAETISRFCQIALGHGATTIRIIATAAVRQAKNRADFVQRVYELCGIEVEVITGEEEARLAHRSVKRSFDLADLPAAVCDIGGGSTEVILSVGGVIEQIVSMPIGAVGLTEHYGVPDLQNPAGYQAMLRTIRRRVRNALAGDWATPQAVFGCGGTFTALAAISMNRVGSADQREKSAALPYEIRGYQLQQAELHHIISALRAMTPIGRLNAPGLSEDRANIIIAGLMIAEEVMRELNANILRIHDRGVRDGIILETLSDSHDALERSDPLQGVIRFGRRCNFEEAHCAHVAKLALSLLDQLGDALATDGVRPEWTLGEARLILEAAALLRDVGYFINYKSHHTHSYHLIVHGDFPGFTRRQVEVIANVARYHRKALPKKKHAHFMRLEPEDRTLVKRLAAVLRLADGLDRTHSQRIDTVQLTLTQGVAQLVVSGQGDLSADLYGTISKADLFEKVFDRVVVAKDANEPETTFQERRAHPRV